MNGMRGLAGEKRRKVHARFYTGDLTKACQRIRGFQRRRQKIVEAKVAKTVKMNGQVQNEAFRTRQKSVLIPSIR